MDVFEEAETHIYDMLDAAGLDTALISITDTLDNLMHDGWTPSEIVKGKADIYISEHIVWLD